MAPSSEGDDGSELGEVVLPTVDGGELFVGVPTFSSFWSVVSASVFPSCESVFEAFAPLALETAFGLVSLITLLNLGFKTTYK